MPELKASNIGKDILTEICQRVKEQTGKKITREVARGVLLASSLPSPFVRGDLERILLRYGYSRSYASRILRKMLEQGAISTIDAEKKKYRRYVVAEDVRKAVANAIEELISKCIRELITLNRLHIYMIGSNNVIGGGDNEEGR